MPLPRRLQPEWLDHLPPSDPRALGSRRDLRRINRIMGHASIVSAAIARGGPADPPKRIVELGAGDGTLMRRLAQRWAWRWPRTQVLLLDRADSIDPAALAAIRRLGWDAEAVQADVFDWLEADRTQAGDLVLANLFLHHFTSEQLASLFGLVAARTPLFVAAEPRRSNFSLFASRLLGLIGCNAVSRHDAVASVHAGFRDTELSVLWPESSGWDLHETGAGWFSHCLIARRRPA